MKYEFVLPQLSYAYTALEPYIDAQTMEVHHAKHHAAYVNNLNKALEGHEDLHDLTLEEILHSLDRVPEDVRTAVRNNGGGHFNHSMFWELMAPNAGGEPTGTLKKAIDSVFSSFKAFKEEFAKSAMTRFGSGWAWLVLNQAQALVIVSTPNQDNPIMDGFAPILGLDVWEHAYYLKYQNKRADYTEAWWNVVNWDQVQKNYTNAKNN